MRVNRCLMSVVVATCCVACGQKGPLVLPDSHAKTPVPVAAVPLEKDRDKPAPPKNQ